MRRCGLLLLILLMLALPAVAGEMRYITDQLVIGLRQEPVDGSSPLEYLKSGMAVEVLEDLGRLVKVKAPSGQVGYVSAQYLVAALTHVPAGPPDQERDRLRGLLAAEQKRATELAAEIEALRSGGGAGSEALRQQLQHAQQELEAAQRRYQELRDSSGDVTAVVKERDQLQKEAARLTAEVETLREQTPRGTPVTDPLPWFVSGGAVFLVGWLTGRASRPKRRF